jgi:hypothetical protein
MKGLWKRDADEGARLPGAVASAGRSCESQKWSQWGAMLGLVLSNQT